MSVLAKYPRTYHLPWSEGMTSDDKLIPSNKLETFVGKEVVVTEKMDGECTTLYHNYMHARSLDSRHNFSRDWVKKMHSVIRFDLPEGWRFVGENLWAEHSIRYEDGVLEGYFYLFAIFDEKGTIIDFDDMLEFAEILDLPVPNVLYRGVYDEKAIKEIADKMDKTKHEGYVVRLKESIPQSDEEEFMDGVAKFVRAGHVDENADHWLSNIKQNGKLKKDIKPNFM
jgi:hypothetical protein